MHSRERVVYIARTSVFVAISTLFLVLATNLTFFIINFLGVTVAAFTTSLPVAESRKGLKWSFFTYIGTALLTLAMGGLGRPMALLVYVLVISPYFIFHYYITHRIKNYWFRFALKAAVMTTIAVTFFLIMTPLFPPVKIVVEIMASVPQKYFGVSFLSGVFISMGAAANLSIFMIPVMDFLFTAAKNVFVKRNLIKTVESAKKDKKKKLESKDKINSTSQEKLSTSKAELFIAEKDNEGKEKGKDNL